MTGRLLRFALVMIGGAAQCLTAQTPYTITDVLRDTIAGVEAAIAPSEGGELSSYRVKLKEEWTEFLYHARDYSDGPGFKGKGGPLLWPAVGAQYPVGTVPAGLVWESEHASWPAAATVFPSQTGAAQVRVPEMERCLNCAGDPFRRS